MANPPELDEDVDLDPERRRYVLEVFARLDALTFYELLEIPRDASEKMVKRAYFQIVRVTHPDRYFGKNLGSYKAKLEAIFARQTRAYETLSDAAARGAYDATLGPAAPAAAPPAPPAAARGPASPAPASSAPASSAPAPAVAAAGPPSRPPPPSAPVDAAVAARKQAALDALKQVMSVNKARADQQVAAAQRALAVGDLVTAAAAYREAVRLAPNDAAIKAAADEVQRQVAQRTGEAARRQADLEERHGHWAQAAASWQRVLAAFPGDAEATARLAAALARAGRAPR
jgi:tetratricopeptide (TPR) repeat protein